MFPVFPLFKSKKKKRITVLSWVKKDHRKYSDILKKYYLGEWQGGVSQMYKSIGADAGRLRDR